MLADGMEFLNTWTGVTISFIIGVILFIVAVLALHTCMDGKK